MSSRLQTLIQRPWNGTLNTTLEASLLNPNEVQKADETILNNKGARSARGGLVYWSYVGTGVQRSSSTTTRTIRVTLNTGITIATNDLVSIFYPSSNNSNYEATKTSVQSISLVSGTTYDITYTATTSLTEGVTADTDFRIGLHNSGKIVGIHDYWYYSAGTKTQRTVAVRSDGTFWLYDENGSQTAISTSGLSLSTPLTHASFATLGEKLVIAVSGNNNLPMIWSGTGNITHLVNKDYAGNDVSATNPAPDLKYLMNHQSRIFGIDFDNPDRIHYCDIDNPESWNGEADSGAVEIAVGDGDSSGFSAIFPPYKGILPVAKADKLFHIVGYAPLFQILDVSSGIGCVSHDSAVAVDHDDVVWASVRGLHTMSATDKYGDIEAGFLSKPLQSTYNALEDNTLGEIRGIYDGTLGAVIWSVAESDNTDPNKLLVYDIADQSWSRWGVDSTNFQVVSMAMVKYNQSNRILMGTYDGMIILYNESKTVDLVNTTIIEKIKTGIIYPDGNPSTIKGFKKIGIYYKTSRSAVNFNVRFQVDNFTVQETNVAQAATADLLGSTFILGSSSLGFTEVLLPNYVDVSGYGFGCNIEIISSGPVDIYGYSIDYELAGDQQEVVRGDS